MRLLKLEHDITCMASKAAIMGLVRIEAEIAVLRAAQVHEKRSRALSRAARQACRRYPVPPERGTAVLVVARAPSTCPLTRRAGRRFRFLERHAVFPHSVLKIILNLAEHLSILPKIHAEPPQDSPRKSSCAFLATEAASIEAPHTTQTFAEGPFNVPHAIQ